MLKNITLNQISIALTLLLALLNVSVFVILNLTHLPIEESTSFWLVLTIVSLGVSYLVVRFFLEKYIFRKIKLVYKIIQNSKKSLPDGSETVGINDQSIEKVNEDVVEWAQRKEIEIRNLTELENYRRKFLGNISHELKTPIFTIQGYIHTLLDGGLKDKKVNVKYLKRAASNVERLKNIVEDLETINQLESGIVELKIEPFDIKTLANEVLSDLEIIAKDFDISLQLKEGAQKGFSVEADRENIRQVLINLVSNSIKYGKEDGMTKIGFYDMADKILVEVSDDGIGIKENHLKHLFGRFYRVDAARSRKQGGSGLGLSIVKHILEAHGQTITVRSTPGEGSTFGFTLKKAS